MKAFIISLSLLLAICIFVGVHSYIMLKLSEDITQKCQETTKLANADQWQRVVEQIDKIDNIWNSRHMWASLTISTHEIEQIEISLMQSKEFARLGQKPDFFGEFTMFTMLIDHIPHQEGFHIEEIL